MDNIEQFISDVRNRTNTFLATGETSQGALAKQVGISGGSLSAFLADNYNGSNENIARKLLPVLESRKAREVAVLAVKEPEIIETGVMREMRFGLQYASDRNDVIVIYGAPGVGKTVTLESYIKTNPAALFMTGSPNIRSGSTDCPVHRPDNRKPNHVGLGLRRYGHAERSEHRPERWHHQYAFHRPRPRV